MSNKYGITPSLAAEFLAVVEFHARYEGIHDVLDEELRPFLRGPRGRTMLEAIVNAWPLYSDEIAGVLRKHGYDQWGWELPAVPAELVALPYDLHSLHRADPSAQPNVPGYLIPGEDDGPDWLEAQLGRVRAALPAGWCAGWLASDVGDTRIIVRPEALPREIT